MNKFGSVFVIAAAMGCTAEARLQKGKCAPMNVREDLMSIFKDPTQLDGVWYEQKKDKFTLNETTGKCNRSKMTGQAYEKDAKTGDQVDAETGDQEPDAETGDKVDAETGDKVDAETGDKVDVETGDQDFSKPIDSGEKFLTEDGEEVQAKDGFHTLWHLSNSQEDIVIDHSYLYTGGIVACPNDPKSKENCYIDWNQAHGVGIVGQADATMVGTDGENWMVTYACK